MPHLRDVRASKSAFQLTTILGVVKQSATATVAKDMKPGASPWEAIGEVITHLIEESSKLVQPISEPENVLKSKPFTMSLRLVTDMASLSSNRHRTLGCPHRRDQSRARRER
jgi:hypothetical protein